MGTSAGKALPAILSIAGHALRVAGTISQAVQPAVHDVTDVTCVQSWFNSPLTTSLTADIYKVRARCGRQHPRPLLCRVSVRPRHIRSNRMLTPSAVSWTV